MHELVSASCHCRSFSFSQSALDGSFTITPAAYCLGSSAESSQFPYQFGFSISFSTTLLHSNSRIILGITRAQPAIRDTKHIVRCPQTAARSCSNASSAGRSTDSTRSITTWGPCTQKNKRRQNKAVVDNRLPVPSRHDPLYSNPLLCCEAAPPVAGATPQTL